VQNRRPEGLCSGKLHLLRHTDEQISAVRYTEERLEGGYHSTQLESSLWKLLLENPYAATTPAQNILVPEPILELAIGFEPTTL
jgi:hypothetical protein